MIKYKLIIYVLLILSFILFGLNEGYKLHHQIETNNFCIKEFYNGKTIKICGSVENLSKYINMSSQQIFYIDGYLIKDKKELKDYLGISSKSSD
jgi:hypothetical protein